MTLAGRLQSVRFSRFLVAGLVNTGGTYLLYLALLLVMPYAWAYSVTYAAGILLGYLLSARFVFRSNISWRTAALYPLVYLVNYAVGLGLLWLAVERLGMPKQVAPLLVLVATTPLMYVMTKTIFRKEQQNG